MKVIVDNLAVEYRDEGSGPVLVMLHGWKDSLITFNALSSRLIDGWRIVRLDLPGFGSSEHPKSPWYLEDYVRFVVKFCAKLNIKPDVYLGHSLGGRIAIKGLSEGEFTAKQLILIASAGIAKSQSTRNRSYQVIAKAGRVATLVPPLVFWRQQLRTRLYRHAGSDYLSSGDLKQTFLNIISEDLQSNAAKLQLPTLLIWGTADTQTPLADGRVLAGLIRHSEFATVDGGTHFVHQEEPDQVARIISEFTQS